MFKRILLISTILLVFTANASGQSSGFGAGMMLGEPTGIVLNPGYQKQMPGMPVSPGQIGPL